MTEKAWDEPRTEIPDAEFLRAVRRHTPAATAEVADAIGVSRRGAHYRLQELVDDGVLARKDIGRAVAWIHPDVLEVDTREAASR